MTTTGADLLIRRLRDHGVTHIFGYPGGQLTPIYDALHRAGDIRHVLARDEQAAAFMADGYARATGRPGVCLAVCGPGVYNAATPLATAFTDSIPVLLLSGQIASAGLQHSSLRSGYYHENDQLSAVSTFTKWRSRPMTPQGIVEDVDRAFAAMRSNRPGPVFLEVPLDVQRAETATTAFPAPSLNLPSSRVNPEGISRLGDLIGTWKRPLLMAGGGVCIAEAEALLTRLADRLGAPVFHTFMGKSAISSEHRLKAGLPWFRATSDLTNMESFFSPLLAEADGMLAVGCRFSQAATGTWTMKPPASLAQIDIDAAEIGRHYPVTLGIQADAKQALQTLLEIVPASDRTPWTLPVPPRESWRLAGLDLVSPLRRCLPHDGILVADITRLGYILLAGFPVYEPKTFLHPAGFVAMGYGIPAAIGAKVACPEKAVVAVVGDGCFQMCGSGLQLLTAVQEKIPIVVVLLSDGSLTLIKAIQERRYENRFIGVDLRNPDFGLFAQSLGLKHWRVEAESTFEQALRAALACGETALVEVVLPR